MNHSKIKITPILTIAAIALLACWIRFHRKPSRRARPSPSSAARAGNSAAALRPRRQQRLRHRDRSPHRRDHQQRHHHQSLRPGPGPLRRKLVEHGQAPIHRQALAARRHPARPQLQPRRGKSQPRRAPGPGPERDRAQRAASQRQRLPRREPGANQPRRRRPAHPPAHPRLHLPHHRRPVQQHRPARQRLAVGPRSHRMEQLPRIQRIRPRRAAHRPRCPRRRRPRGLRHVSPDHRNQRARRLRPRAARHRNRALPADAAEAAGRTRRPDRR